MNAPCKGCKDRYVTETTRCHSTCERYKEWLELSSKAKAEKDKLLNTTTIGSARQWSHNALRIHKRKEGK